MRGHRVTVGIADCGVIFGFSLFGSHWQR